MDVRLTVIGSSPAWPNPGGARSGYLVDGRLLLDCGPGVLARLREREPWPTVDAIAITHFHLDHWGDLVPWVWGSLFGPGESAPKPALWLPPGGARGAAADPRQCSAARTCSSARSRSRSTSRACRSSPAGLEVTAVPVDHYDIEAYGFRVKGDRILAYSGDSGPGGAGRARARRRPAPARRRSRTAATTAPTRPPLARGGRQGGDATRERCACCSRTGPSSGRRRAGVELAYDGLEVEL